MLANTDWVGLATFITALGAVLTGVLTTLVGLRQNKPISEVHAAVTTPPQSPPLGQMVSDAVGTVEDIKTALNGKT